MPDFVKDPQFLEGLKEELIDQIFYDKNNDLYKFQQVSTWITVSPSECTWGGGGRGIIDWF